MRAWHARAVPVTARFVLVVCPRDATSAELITSTFRSVPFSGAALIGVVALATLGGFLFLNTLYLQDVRGYSASAGIRSATSACSLASAWSNVARRAE